MNTRLKSLEQHNMERRQAQSFALCPQPNGIACPHCSSELMDTDPSYVLASIPPQTAVHCQCGFKGTRVK